MNIKTLPANYAIEIWQESWNLIAGKRLMFFFAAAVMVILLAVASFVPIIGGALQGFLGPFLGSGFILLVHNYKTKNKFEFDTLFEALSNREVFNKILPLAVFLMLWNGMFSIVQVIITSGKGDIMGTLIVIMGSLIISVFTYFGTPLMLFKDHGVFRAMSLSAEALTYNVVVFLVYSIILLMVGVIGLIPLGLGLLILFAPISCHGYLFYIHIFEDELFISNVQLTEE